MTFKLEHHNKILTILQSLDNDLLCHSQAYFGGGTVLTLDFNEYRWSQDIDFICSMLNGGYKIIRRHIYEQGYKSLFKDQQTIQIHRGTMDQYGIRLLVEIDHTPIKLEIIAEARFSTDQPRYPDWSPVPCLSIEDSFVSKLLANADRYLDRSIKSRDLIDLAILRTHYELSQEIITKSENAYEVVRPLRDAIQNFQNKPDYREECFDNLQIEKNIWAKVIDGLDLLADDYNLNQTSRAFWEQHDLFNPE